MSRHVLSPQARYLVGEAVYDVRFPQVLTLSSELVKRVESTLSSDSPWQFTVRPSGLLLKTRDYQGLGDLPEKLHQLSGLSFSAIFLKYSNAVTIEPRNLKKLFADRVAELNPHADENFAQEISGTWDRGRYMLSLRIEAPARFTAAHAIGHWQLHRKEVRQKRIYRSAAYVTAENVAPDRLSDALRDVDREGLRLLSWPIAPQMINALQPYCTTKPEEEPETDPFAELSMPESVLPFTPSFASKAAAKTARERAELIARRLEGEDFSAIDEARLEALTQRVRSLLPQVTNEEWQVLEDISSRLGEAEAYTERIRKKYGLAG
jgi:hypothetical protein